MKKVERTNIIMRYMIGESFHDKSSGNFILTPEPLFIVYAPHETTRVVIYWPGIRSDKGNRAPVCSHVSTPRAFTPVTRPWWKCSGP